MYRVQPGRGDHQFPPLDLNMCGSEFGQDCGVKIAVENINARFGVWSFPSSQVR